MTRKMYRTSECGKGDNQRDRLISREEWQKNHERTFGKKLSEPKEEEPSDQVDEDPKQEPTD